MTGRRDWDRVKEEIRSRIDLISFVGEYVRLEKKGTRHWACCPFHNEDTPSFTVTPEMGIYKCFGCGKGGDVFSFLMEIEGCEFPEAVSALARRTGVELPSSGGDKDRRSDREEFFELNSYAAKKYSQAFWGEAGQRARKYMFDRGFGEETLKKFKVGYAPSGWDNLLKAMKRDGKSLKKALQIGLIRKSKNNVFDMFRDRVIFPIEDLSSRVVGFGGRALKTDDRTPKYVNTQETPIFSKSRVLYGLVNARPNIRDTERCLVMEGYTDVLRCHEAGFETAVAALGTALTETQVRLLKRYVEELVLVYDGDEAGEKATVRGGRVALKNGLVPSVVALPAGSDPSDMISDSLEKFTEVVRNREQFIEFFFERLAAEHGLDRAAGKEKILKNILPLIRFIPGRLQKEERVKWLAARLNTDEAFIFEQLSRLARGGTNRISERIKAQTGQSLEELFLASLAHHPGAFEEAMGKISRKDFLGKNSSVVVEALFKIKKRGEEFTTQRWMELVPAEVHSYLAGLLSAGDTAEFVAGIAPGEIANMIKNRSIRHERSMIAKTLSEQDRENDPGSLDAAKKALLEQTIKMKQQEENQD